MTDGTAPDDTAPDDTGPDDTGLDDLRGRLVDEVRRVSGVRDERIAAALRDVPRHLFLPHLPPRDAYLDDAIVTKR
ncbi:MAG TPA: hypothetical protein VFQ68_36010, partial [Streptosporangiaceae bacterium]|nr:hypothetical protein [Streptosporangiaceae bacterium]